MQQYKTISNDCFFFFFLFFLFCAGQLLRRIIAHCISKTLELDYGFDVKGMMGLWDDIICLLKDDKTEENTFEILQHSDTNINNS